MPTSIAQRNIEASKSPGFMPTSIARWSIHTAKSLGSMLPCIPGCWHRIRIDDPLWGHSFLGPRNGNDDDDDR